MLHECLDLRPLASPRGDDNDLEHYSQLFPPGDAAIYLHRSCIVYARTAQGSSIHDFDLFIILNLNYSFASAVFP